MDRVVPPVYEPEVRSGNFTASLGREYLIVASCTVTDPSPTEGRGFQVIVRNGTATVGGTAYAAGVKVRRYYHSGAWGNAVEPSIGAVATSARLTEWDVNRGITDSAIEDGVTGGVLTISGTLTTNRTWTAPDRADTFAGLGAQTFTGNQFINASAVVGATALLAAERVRIAGGTAFDPTAGGSDITFGDGVGSFGKRVTALQVIDSATVNANLNACFFATAALTTPGQRSRIFRVNDRAFIDFELISGGRGWLRLGSDFNGRVDAFSVNTNTGHIEVSGSGVFGATAFIGSERLRIAGGTATNPGATDVTIGGGEVRAGSGYLTGNGLVRSGATVSTATLNTWVTVSTNFMGIYVFRDASSGGTAVVQFDTTTGATVISSSMTGVEFQRSAASLQIRTVSGTASRLFGWNALIARDS